MLNLELLIGHRILQSENCEQNLIFHLIYQGTEIDLCVLNPWKFYRDLAYSFSVQSFEKLASRVSMEGHFQGSFNPSISTAVCATEGIKRGPELGPSFHHELCEPLGQSMNIFPA